MIIYTNCVTELDIAKIIGYNSYIMQKQTNRQYAEHPVEITGQATKLRLAGIGGLKGIEIHFGNNMKTIWPKITAEQAIRGVNSFGLYEYANILRGQILGGGMKQLSTMDTAKVIVLKIAGTRFGNSEAFLFVRDLPEEAIL